MQLGGDAPGDAALIRQSKNSRDAAFQIQHGSLCSPKIVVRRNTSPPALPL
jgi:hypothetical protein